MSRLEKTGFSVNNEITNAATGSQNSHSVNSTYGGNQIKCEKVIIVQKQEFTVHGSTARTNKAPPNIISRDFWGAEDPNLEMKKLQKPVGMIVICHTVTESEVNSDRVRQICQTMQEKHLQEGFGDIVFNFMIGCDGEVYEGRGFDFVGAHTLKYNKSSLGIGFIGDFRHVAPPEASIKKCQALLKLGIEAGHISRNYQVKGICELKPHEGPGQKLFEKLSQLLPEVVDREG